MDTRKLNGNETSAESAVVKGEKEGQLSSLRRFHFAECDVPDDLLASIGLPECSTTNNIDNVYTNTACIQ